jgi:hypothetical protein
VLDEPFVEQAAEAAADDARPGVGLVEDVI